MPAVAINYGGPIPLPNNIRNAPVAFGLVAVSSIAFLLFYALRIGVLLPLFNFVPLGVKDGVMVFGEPSLSQWWRFITPTLLHFSWMHIIFNCLWLWEFGRRIEARLGSVNLFGIFLVSAIFSNWAQYWVSGPSLFGGMSGVVYGFLGFIWSANKVRPSWLEPLPHAIFGFMFVWLILGAVGALEFFGGGAIANGAHAGGLVIGLILGPIIAIATKPESY